MKRILVFVGDVDKTSSGVRFVHDIQEYSQDEYIVKSYSDLVIQFKKGNLSLSFFNDDLSIDTCDLVYLRGISSSEIRHVLAAYLTAKNIPVVNSESTRFQMMTKLEQYAVFALAGIPVPDGVFVARPEYYEYALTLLNSPFPIVAKSISGKNGRDNALIYTLEEFKRISMYLPIFQAFIPNEFDYRVIVAGDSVALTYKRIRHAGSRGHQNNIGQGGVREMVELPQELHGLALRAAHAVGREFAGLDLMTNSETGETVVLEANFNFGTPDFTDKALKYQYYTRLSQYMTSLCGKD